MKSRPLVDARQQIWEEPQEETGPHIIRFMLFNFWHAKLSVTAIGTVLNQSEISRKIIVRIRNELDQAGVRRRG